MDEKQLAEIENRSCDAMGIGVADWGRVREKDVRVLIAEVRRLQRLQLVYNPSQENILLHIDGMPMCLPGMTTTKLVTAARQYVL